MTEQKIVKSKLTVLKEHLFCAFVLLSFFSTNPAYAEDYGAMGGAAAFYGIALFVYIPLVVLTIASLALARNRKQNWLPYIGVLFSVLLILFSFGLRSKFRFNEDASIAFFLSLATAVLNFFSGIVVKKGAAKSLLYTVIFSTIWIGIWLGVNLNRTDRDQYESFHRYSLQTEQAKSVVNLINKEPKIFYFCGDWQGMEIREIAVQKVDTIKLDVRPGPVDLSDYEQVRINGEGVHVPCLYVQRGNKRKNVVYLLRDKDGYFGSSYKPEPKELPIAMPK